MVRQAEYSTTRKQRRFTAEFKAEAVRLVVSSGKPLAQIARELGLHEQVLCNWKRQAEETGKGNGVSRDHFTRQEEIRRLRRQLADVTEERDILKAIGHVTSHLLRQQLLWP